MYGWQQFSLSLLSWDGLLSSFNLPTYVILAGLAPFFLTVLDIVWCTATPAPLHLVFPSSVVWGTGHHIR